MIRRLLDRLRGRKCGLCRNRYHDLARHQLTEHSPAELMQATEMGLR